VAGVISLSEFGLRLGLASLDGTLGVYLPMEREILCRNTWDFEKRQIHLGWAMCRDCLLWSRHGGVRKVWS
jgi:hypothetical protein